MPQSAVPPLDAEAAALGHTISTAAVMATIGEMSGARPRWSPLHSPAPRAGHLPRCVLTNNWADDPAATPAAVTTSALACSVGSPIWRRCSTPSWSRRGVGLRKPDPRIYACWSASASAWSPTSVRSSTTSASTSEPARELGHAHDQGGSEPAAVPCRSSRPWSAPRSRRRHAARRERVRGKRMELILVRPRRAGADPTRTRRAARRPILDSTERGREQSHSGSAAWLAFDAIDRAGREPKARDATETVAPIAKTCGLEPEEAADLIEYYVVADDYIPIEEMRANNPDDERFRPRWWRAAGRTSAASCPTSSVRLSPAHSIASLASIPVGRVGGGVPRGRDQHCVGARRRPRPPAVVRPGVHIDVRSSWPRHAVGHPIGRQHQRHRGPYCHPRAVGIVERYPRLHASARPSATVPVTVITIDRPYAAQRRWTAPTAALLLAEAFPVASRPTTTASVAIPSLARAARSVRAPI